MAVSASDPFALQSAWKASPPGMLAADPRLVEAREAFRRKMRSKVQELENDWRISLRDLRETLTGGCAVFTTLYEWMNPEVYEFDLCFLAEMDGNSARARALIERALDKTPVDARRMRRTHRGETIYEVRWTQRYSVSAPVLPPGHSGGEYEEFGPAETPAPGSAAAVAEEVPIVVQYALVDRWLIVCEGHREPIRAIIDALKDPARRLGQNADFRRASRALGEPGAIQFWARPGQFWKTYADHQKQIRQAGGESGAASGAGSRPGAGGGGPDWSALGLQDLGGALVNLHIQPDQIRLDAAVVFPDNLRGPLAPLFRPGKFNSLATASLVPPDALSYSSTLIDGQELWSALRETLIRFMPAAWGVFNLQIQNTNREFGIALERGLIGSIGGELATYQRRPPSRRARTGVWSRAKSESSTFLIGLRDGRSFRQNASRLIAALRKEPYNVPLDSFAYLDQDVWFIDEKVDLPMLTRPAWTSTDQALLITSDSQELPGLLRALAGRGEKSLASTPEFQSAVAQFPAEGRLGFSYITSEDVAGTIGAASFLLSRFGNLGEWIPQVPLRPGVAADGPASTEWMQRYLGPLVMTSAMQPRLWTGHVCLMAPKSAKP